MSHRSIKTRARSHGRHGCCEGAWLDLPCARPATDEDGFCDECRAERMANPEAVANEEGWLVRSIERARVAREMA